MRPAILRLRDELGSLYPLASAKAWLLAEGRELIDRIQDEVGLESRLLIVVRNGQGVLDWSSEARGFEQSADWTGSGCRVRPWMPPCGTNSCVSPQPELANGC